MCVKLIWLLTDPIPMIEDVTCEKIASKDPPIENTNSNPDRAASTTLTTKELEEQFCSVPPVKLKEACHPGAWAKLLRFTPPATPTEIYSPSEDNAVLNIIHSDWPSLEHDTKAKQKKRQFRVGVTKPLINKLPPPWLKEDGTHRFPWAAKVDPTKRNLFRAVTPTFRSDGTLEVIIQSKSYS